MSKIPIDLPPDRYPELSRKNRRGKSNLLVFLFTFAAIFAVVMVALEIF